MIGKKGRYALMVLGMAGLAGPAGANFVALQSPTATFSQSGFFVGSAIDGNVSNFTGWAVLRPDSQTLPETAVFETATNVGTAAGTMLTFSLDQFFTDHTIGRFRLSATTDDRSLYANGAPIGGSVAANWTVLTPAIATSTNGPTLLTLGDGSVLAVGPNPQTATYTVTASTALVGITGFRLEVLADPSLPSQGPGRQNSNGNFVLTEFRVEADPIPAPEPSSLTLCGIAGLSSLALAWRRRGRAATA